jgi:uncharacterized protein
MAGFLPPLGVGIVFIPGLERLLDESPELVDFVEVEPEMFWNGPAGTQPQADASVIEWLERSVHAKVVHGIGFAVGGCRRPPPAHLAAIRQVVELLDAHWASEHLSFNEAASGGSTFKTGFLLPPRQTDAGVQVAASTIRECAAKLSVPFAVETGANYLKPRSDELSDGQFIREVVETADCGLLLDLHNAYVNERSGRQPIAELIDELPLERVWEVHLAGGFELDGYWLDGHSGEMPQPLVDVAVEVIPRLPNLRALTFELLPEFLPNFGCDGVSAELMRLRNLWQLRPVKAHVEVSEDERRRFRRGVKRSPTGAPDRCAPAEWEATLGGLVLGHPVTGSLAEELCADPGIAILRRLVDEVRGGMLAAALPLTVRLLALTRSEEGFQALLGRFWRQSTPSLFSGEEGLAFAAFLIAQGDETPYLGEVVRLEAALIRARIDRVASTIHLSHDPVKLVGALEAGELPRDAPVGAYAIQIS